MMDSANTPGRSNPLIQRVRRHAAMSVLFRSIEPTTAVSSLSHLPVTQAMWLPVAAETLPIGQTIEPIQEALVVPPAPPLQPFAQQPLPVTPTAVSTPPAASVFRQETTTVAPKETATATPALIPSVPMLLQPAVTTTPRSPAPPTASVFRQEATAVPPTPTLPRQPASTPPSITPPVPAAPADAPSVTEDEPAWRRLQTIYNRHQERLAEEETTQPETAVSPPPVQRVPITESAPKIPLPEAPPPSRPRPIPLATPTASQPVPTVSRQSVSPNFSTTPPVLPSTKVVADKVEDSSLKAISLGSPSLSETVFASEGGTDKGIADVSRKTTADSETGHTASVVAPTMATEGGAAITPLDVSPVPVNTLPTMTTEGGAAITPHPVAQIQTPATPELEEISRVVAPTVIGSEVMTTDKPIPRSQVSPVMGEVAARTAIEEATTPLAHKVSDLHAVDEAGSHAEDTLITSSAVSGISPAVQKKEASESPATAKVEPPVTNQTTVSNPVSHLAEPVSEQVIPSSPLVMPKREGAAIPEMVSPTVPGGVTSPKTSITGVESGQTVSAPVSHLAEPTSERPLLSSPLVMPKREETAVPETISPMASSGLTSQETSLTGVEPGETVTVFNKLDGNTGSQSSEPATSERAAPAIGYQSVPPDPLVEGPRAVEPALPLEAVWPVQRQKTHPDSVPSLQLAPAEQPVTDYPAEEAEKVRTALNKVSVGQPTDSTVELVLPRRPRPDTPSSQSPTTRLAQVQRQPEPRITADSPTPQSTIPTEIGPLPPDLWQIIGQKPPTAVSPSPAITRQPTPASPPPVMRQSETAVTAPPPMPASMAPIPPPITADSLPATVMRQPEVPGRSPQGDFSSLGEPPSPAQTALTGYDYLPDMVQLADEPPASASPPVAAGKGGGEAAKTAEVDIDAVARRVYSDLKRRLVVEWERVRGKF